MLQWHHKPVPIRMLDHHRRGNNRSLNSSRAPKSTHPPMHPPPLCPTPPTPLLPPQPPQRAPLTPTQRSSPTPARVPRSHRQQATQHPGLRSVLPLAHTPLNHHFLAHLLGSLVPRPLRTPLHTLMEGTATPQAPMGHQPNHPQLDRFIGQVLGYHNHTPEPLCVCLSHDPPSRLSPSFLLLLCLFLTLRFVVCVPVTSCFCLRLIKTLEIECVLVSPSQRLNMGRIVGSVPVHFKACYQFAKIYYYIQWRHCVTAQPYLAVFFFQSFCQKSAERQTCHTTWKRYVSVSLYQPLLTTSIQKAQHHFPHHRWDSLKKDKRILYHE